MKFREIRETDSKWVQPFEDNAFRAYMRRVTEAETNRIFDQAKIYPGSQKNSMTKLSRVSDALMLASVTEWEHPEAVNLYELDSDGKPTATPAPCNDDNKARLDKIIVDYERDGEEVAESLYSILVRKFNETTEEVAKN